MFEEGGLETADVANVLPDLNFVTRENRWKFAVESAGQAIWEIQASTGKRFHSDLWFKMRGLQSDDPRAHSLENWLACVHPDDRAYVQNEISKEALNLKCDIRREFREQHADGHYIWVLCRGRVVTIDEQGNADCIMGTDTDISALKTTEEKFQRLSDRFQFAMGTSNVCIWEFDLVNKRPIWDKQMRNLFGIEDADGPLPPDVWERSVHPDDFERANREAMRIIEECDSYNMDYRIVWPDGTIRHIRCRAAYHIDELTGATLIGASWDITKDVEREQELERAIALAATRNAELEVARNQMEHNALHDVLTGLPNRRQLDIWLERISTSEADPENRVAMLLVDLDRFKHINDTFGHAAGDKVLMRAAGILRDVLGSKGVVARTGGDEFIAVIEKAPDDVQLMGMAETIIERMAEPIEFEGHECLFGASIGVASMANKKATGNQLFINADTALYRAKNKGRNQVCLFSVEMQIAVVASKRRGDAILRGLERNEFFPFYQLQVDAHTHAVSGVEALARWRHPDEGILSPDKFLSVAEEINAMSRIDDAILAQALADLSRWRAAGIDVPHLSVNVSAKRLGDEKLVERLKEYIIPENSLSFELLESIFLDEQNPTIARNLREIRERGIGIEIDDFGTGHASIAGLISLRPDTFKIDRGLIQPIVVSVERRRLVRSIVDIGKSLGIQVVAEGVETAEHAEVLRKLDCDHLQGYYFAKPMDAVAIAEFIRKQAWVQAA
jgi:diguanylate cyclase (GGDEF)-like protein/PAS domain S-box-containing protein